MKDKSTAIILALFFGGIGIHKFYLGRNFQGLIYLFFCWTFVPWAISVIEGLCFMTYSTERWDKEFNQGYNTKPSLSIQDVPRDEKKCPDCAELILAAAKKCKHCGCDVSERSTA